MSSNEKQTNQLQVRAVIEGQLLSKRGHAERFGLPSPPKRIIATGGASANQSILSSMAAIFGSDVYTVEKSGMQLSHCVLSTIVCDLV